MNRQHLVDVLSRIEPALSTKDLVPVLTCFCFKDGVMYAYDDIVALQAKSELPISGGLSGSVLLDFLKASKADEVDLTPLNDKEVEFKVGRAKLKLPLFPTTDFVFEKPSRDKTVALALDPVIVEALKIALVSMGVDPAHPWRLGVTVAFKTDAILFYSSDNFSGTKVQLECEVPADFQEKVTVLPPRFCSLFVDVARKEECEDLILSDKWVEVTFKSGLVLFSRTIDAVDEDSYSGLFGKIKEEAAAVNPQEIPKGFERCLDRALVILQRSSEKTTEFTVSPERLSLHTTSAIGLADDYVPFKDHKDVKVKSSPELLKKAMEGASKIAFTPSGVYLEGEGFIRLVMVLS